MILHTVNKSPFGNNALRSCLKFTQKGSAVLLIEDGVYGALKDTEVSDLLQSAMGNVNIYALGPDLQARGVADRVLEGVKVVDYADFVDLATQHNAVQSWL